MEILYLPGSSSKENGGEVSTTSAEIKYILFML